MKTSRKDILMAACNGWEQRGQFDGEMQDRSVPRAGPVNGGGGGRRRRRRRRRQHNEITKLLRAQTFSTACVECRAVVSLTTLLLCGVGVARWRTVHTTDTTDLKDAERETG